MKTVFVAFAMLGASSLAHAQEADAPAATNPANAGPLIEVEDETRTVPPLGVTVDDLDDADVYGPDGERIGEIEEVLMTADSELVAVTLEYGGFLGFGDREVVVQLSELRRQGDDLAIGLTEAELETLPDWQD